MDIIKYTLVILASLLGITFLIGAIWFFLFGLTGNDTPKGTLVQHEIVWEAEHL